MPFSVSIAILSLTQAALIALPRPAISPTLARLGGRWWGLVPPGSIALVVAAIALESETAQALTYLALFAVPPLAALALAHVVRGGRPALAVLVVPLFVFAWVSRDSLAGEAAALALTGLACVSLGWLLACVVPSRWLKLGIYAMASIDAWLVGAELLQEPNAILNAAAPGSLPQLQYASFGSAVTGFGDLFLAATLGSLLAADRRLQLTGAALLAVLALSFDLLFFAVDSLPATVPVAVALALLDLKERRRGGLAREAPEATPSGR